MTLALPGVTSVPCPHCRAPVARCPRCCRVAGDPAGPLRVFDIGASDPITTDRWLCGCGEEFEIKETT